MTRDLVAASNQNLQTVMVQLAEYLSTGEISQFGAVTVVSSGLPVPIFNRAFVFEEPRRDDLVAAVEWLDDRDVPYWVTVTESATEAVHSVVEDLGLEKSGTQPGMVLPSLRDLPPPSDTVDIVEVTDSDTRVEFTDVNTVVFDIPREVAEQVDPAVLSTETTRAFVGRVDGEPAACGMLIQTGDVAGVYTIGVLEEFRRQGIGEAMNWAVLRAARDNGSDIAVLQSSEMAYPLYQQMGYETVVTYHIYQPPS